MYRHLCLSTALCAAIVNPIAIDRAEAAAKKGNPETAPMAASNDVSTNPDPIDLIRQDLRAGKTELIASSISFADADKAAAFWSLYRQYESELREVGDEQLALTKEYLAAVNTLTDAQAADFTDRSLSLKEDILDLRKKYVGKISKEVSPLTAAKFLQVESLVQNVVDLELLAKLPLVRADGIR